MGASSPPQPYVTSLEGLEYLDKVIDIDQTPDRGGNAALEPGHLLPAAFRPDPRRFTGLPEFQGARLQKAGTVQRST